MQNERVAYIRGHHRKTRSWIAYIKCMSWWLVEYRKSDEIVRRSQNSGKACDVVQMFRMLESQNRQIKLADLQRLSQYRLNMHIYQKNAQLAQQLLKNEMVC